MGKLARKRFESRDRRAERFSEIGRKFEGEIADLLQKMLEEKLILGFTRQEPNSKADSEGRDFTVTAAVAGKETHKSFGVTISLKSWNEAKILHPDTVQLCFPMGTKPETIRKRILELFAQH